MIPQHFYTADGLRADRTLPPMIEDDVGFETWFAEHGYEQVSGLPEYHPRLGGFGEWRVWRNPTATWPYAVIFDWSPNDVELIWCDGLPSMFDFAAKYLVPFAQTGKLNWTLSLIEDALDKAFHAWHGHEIWATCRECAPHEHESGKRFIAAMRQRAHSQEGRQ
jgi:hypothetical protein